MTFDLIRDFVAQPEGYEVQCFVQILIICRGSSVVLQLSRNMCFESLFSASARPARHFSPRVVSPHNLDRPHQRPGAVHQEVNTGTHLLHISETVDVNIISPLISVRLESSELSLFSSAAGSSVSLPWWLSVRSSCVSDSEEKPLTGSPTSMCCLPLTPAQSISQTTSWGFCRPVCGAGRWSRGRRSGSSTPPVGTSSGAFGTKVAEASCSGCVWGSVKACEGKFVLMWHDLQKWRLNLCVWVSVSLLPVERSGHKH